jgi:putative ABC transport system ATP-binding protein
VQPSDAIAASCSGLVKTYSTDTGRVHALKGIDAEFSAGAVTAVVGPSGSGKSSLLRLLAALDLPSAGTVLVGGRDLATLSPPRLRIVRRSVVGYVFQRPADNFISYLTLEEHLILAGGTGTRPDAEGLLAQLGLTERRQSLPRELSGGEQQRAAFAVALMASPQLVVADEPTAELDSRSGADLLGILRGLVSTGVAFVVATHDRNVMRIADEVVELEHGARRGTAPAPNRAAPVFEGSPSVGAETILDGEELTKVYIRGMEQIHALDDVDLALRPGEVAGLVGRSGSGKTTLLSVLAGWERPDRGTLSWLGEGARTDLASLPWGRLAVVPQSFGLMDELTIRENIEYPARLAAQLGPRRARVDELLGDLGLEHLADRLPFETSIGEQQRAAVARALVLSPQLLLADEPTGHQDAGWSDKVLALLKEAAADGTGCLVATHNTDVVPYFDVVHEISNGRLTPEAAKATR